MQLRWWGHTLFAAGYCSVAAVTVLLLALFRPHTDPLLIGLTGVVVILAGGLVHEVVVRRANERKLHDRQIRMRQAYEDLVEMFLKFKAKTRAAAAAAEPPAAATIPDAAPAPAPLPESPPRRAPSRVPRPAAEAVPAATPTPTSDPVPVAAPATPPVAVSPLSPGDAGMVEMIREALAAERIEAFLQPVVTLPARKTRFFEVLSRIRLADDSLILPERFLRVAEHEGLLPAIDELCLARVAGMIRETDKHHHAVGFFCNVGAATLADPAFHTRFLGGGGDPRHLHGKLVFEMSQRDLAAELVSPLGILGDLAAAGFRFSMDRVEHLDIDLKAAAAHHVRCLKLDCAFFFQPETRAAAIALRQQVEGLPMELIVEKIETERQLLDLEDLGLELAQGYLFGEPRLSRRPA
ncbi:MAG: EAL domain-containing protein [Rhodospirillaceae bacterium]